LFGQAAVTIEAGARWLEAYDAVTNAQRPLRAGRRLPHRRRRRLAAGGGFGSFSKMFGMAAASLLEAEVVTADGKVRSQRVRTGPLLGPEGGGGGSLGGHEGHAGYARAPRSSAA
jgi:hypothetical protein